MPQTDRLSGVHGRTPVRVLKESSGSVADFLLGVKLADVAAIRLG